MHESDNYPYIQKAHYPVDFRVKSKFANCCLQRLPVFKGHTLILTALFKFAPISNKAFMQVNGTHFVMDLSYSTHVSCMRVGEYEKVATQLIAKTLVHGDNFLDVGANWGYFSALASHYIGAEGVVYSIEANPQTFNRLSLMLRSSGAANVLPFNLAVCDRDATIVEFATPWFGSDAFGHISNKSQWRNQIVLSTTLDSFWTRVGTPKFKIAKIDVEGMEPKVLAGAEKCLSEGVSDYVIVEVNKWTRERCGVAYEACYKYLSNYGFTHVYQPTDQEYKKISLTNSVLPCEKTMLFARSPLTE